ncbi:MAG: hypothetical protein OEY14_17645 [Myxococcales bacterium]|nr:hypothetical protein [Myxococcales bacterium]
MSSLQLCLASLLLLLHGLAWSSGASAQTTIPGGSTGASAIWTAAGSPYTVQGDVVAPAGGTLTIEAGAEVRFAAADGLGAGLDPARVEL